METLQLLIAFILITLTYNLGQLFFTIKSHANDTHYFLGFGPKIIDFKIGSVQFTLGIYIPFFPFARMYRMHDGKKERSSMPWEFHQLKLGKRVIATMGGTIALIITGILLFIVTSYFEAEQYISKEEVNRLGIYPSELAQKVGFKKGDKITSVNGKDYESFYDIIYPESGTTYQILRDGKAIDITINQETGNQKQKSFGDFFLYLQTPLEVGDVIELSPAEVAGIVKGDKILAVNDVPVYKQFEIRNALLRTRNDTALVKIERFNSYVKDTIYKRIRISKDERLGVLIDEHIQYSLKENSLIEAITKGCKRSWRTVYSNFTAIFKIHSGRQSQSMGSFTTIGKAYSESFNWVRLGRITGSLFLNIALLTLLPLPRAIFWEFIPLTYEGIVRKPFSLKTFKMLGMLGYLILVAITLFSIISDMMKIIG
jgi:regulator of sigma E protease